MLFDMKSYWSTKTHRERVVIGLLATLMLTTFLYFMLINPLIDFLVEKKTRSH